jgi:hypothetical protein
MAASVLNSSSAVDTSVLLFLIFVKFREMVSTSKELRYKLAQLERRLDTHADTIRFLITDIHQLMESTNTKQKNPI